MPEIHPAFEVHMLNESGRGKALELAAAFSELMAKCSEAAGKKQSRELSIVTTKLEEACFFAKKAMASCSENQLQK